MNKTKGQTELIIAVALVLIASSIIIATQFGTGSPTGGAITSPPTGINADPGTNPGEILISWNAVTGADNYQIDFTDNPDPKTGWWCSTNFACSILTSSTTSITNTTTEPAAIWYYRVKACNTEGCSDWSTENSSYPKIGLAQATGPSTGTTGLNIQLNGTINYTVNPTYSWIITVNPSGCILTGETTLNPTINCSTSGARTIQLNVTNEDNQTSNDDTTITIYVSDFPSTPGLPIAVAGDSRVDLSWDAVPNTTHYKLKYKTSPTGPEITFMTENLYLAHSGLTNGLTYYYSLQACNTSGCSAWTSPAVEAIPTAEETIPSIPSNISATKGTNPGEILISWNAVTGADNYQIDFTDNPDPKTGWWCSTNFACSILTSSTTSITNTTTEPAKMWYYRVNACNTEGCSDWSTENSSYPKIGANAGTAYSGTPNTNITLNGSVLFLPETATPTYLWQITQNNSNSDCSLTNPATVHPTIKCLTTGTGITVRLTTTISSPQADTATDTATINITSSGDTTPPTVTITNPINGTGIGGLILIQATASDVGGVKHVEFYVNNSLKGTDISSPYQQGWDTSIEPTGSYTIKAIAEDNSGNTAQDEITITINNGSTDTTNPTISITAPTNLSTVNSTVLIQANATDNVAIKNVEIYIDNLLKVTDTSSPYTFSWNTTTATNTSHTIKAKAKDTSDNTAETTITVTVNNNVSGPVCGNEIKETGEECELDAQCPSQTTCNYSNQQFGTKPGICSNCDCTEGNWVYATKNSSQYCLRCNSCLDDETGNCSEECGDTIPPATPTGLTVIRTTTDSITVQWNTNTETDLKKYEVYYGKNSRDYINSIVALPDETIITIENLDSDTQYFIAVKAVDNGGNKSVYSAEVNGKTEGITIQKPLVPTGLKAELIEGKVKLEWNHSSPQPENYIIQRKTKDESFDQINTTTENKYLDEEIEKEKTYEYRIAAYKNGKRSDFSNTIEIEIKEKLNCEEDNECNEECDSDPDCKTNLIPWGIGTAIIIVSTALAYVLFTVDI